MKKIIFLLFLIQTIVLAQTANTNYLKTTAYKIATQTTIASPTIVQAAVNVTYADGLGRTIQTIARQQSASGKNIVSHFEYDAFGRQVKEFLPYSTQTTGLDFETNAAANQTSYVQYNNQNRLFAKTI